jgi:hypothetical protein
MAKVETKIVRVGYGFLLNQPNHGKIEKEISKYLGKGWELQNRFDKDVGCFSQLYFGRGTTELTFIRRR